MTCCCSPRKDSKSLSKFNLIGDIKVTNATITYLGRYMQARNAARDRYYDRLVEYIDDLIQNTVVFIDEDSVELDYESLPLTVKSELTRLMIESEDREVSECFLDPSVDIIDDDVTCALLELLRNPTFESKTNLSDLILERSTQTYRIKLQQLINDRLYYLRDEYLIEHGLTRKEYEDDIIWTRSAY